jgi:hypothetical protein
VDEDSLAADVAAETATVFSNTLLVVPPQDYGNGQLETYRFPAFHDCSRLFGTVPISVLENSLFLNRQQDEESPEGSREEGLPGRGKRLSRDESPAWAGAVGAGGYAGSSTPELGEKARSQREASTGEEWAGTLSPESKVTGYSRRFSLFP